jgi:hypothetical protein
MGVGVRGTSVQSRSKPHIYRRRNSISRDEFAVKIGIRVVKDLIGLCLSLQELTWADFVYMSVGARGIFCGLFSVLEGAAA